MDRLRFIPPWLRRGLEAGGFAALLALGTLLGYMLGAGVTSDAVLALPGGWTTTFLLALPVLALGSMTVAWPIGMAATRSDAILGACAGFLIGVDVTVLLASARVGLPGSGLAMPLGLIVGLLAAGPALVGLVASQLFSPVGFGRRAAGAAALASAVTAAPLLLLASRLG